MAEQEAKEQFEILYKSAQGKSLEVLLKEILASPHIYSFVEYAEWPKIKAYLSTAEGEAYKRMVDVFSFGTVTDYETNKKSLPELNPKLMTKLRLLTLLSLFEQSRVNSVSNFESEVLNHAFCIKPARQ